ncbi:MAG: hypothetical protein A2270_04375 [Elusimicrobia bacterium RIFOXYA12_FULL_51_18]|nr:MAG: hypothetical protein A2270_04375 [Elusimicrobia bacterium RIFOXYA12_FULL_51_18]OGS30048.1 MAG: hypothetical protein A2218_12950 [Elusimicrobia bacterium RIFOXYA2_FULL_53_38]
MSKYTCPLCKQDVTKSLYEQITGVWKEKEKRLADLKLKEAELHKREQNLKQDFEEKKKKYTFEQKKALAKSMRTQEKEFQQERAKINADYTRKLQREVGRAKRAEKMEMNRSLRQFRANLEKSTSEKFERERYRMKRERDQAENRRKDMANKLSGQITNLRLKNEAQQAKIQSLEEQTQQNQTAQMLGLLDEKIFLAKLRESFPKDEFQHTGKGGDILHMIKDKSKIVGKIVYELKKVAHFSKSHVTQTYKARQMRDAEYGILITNAKKSKNNTGFSIEKGGVICINPAGAMALIGILRENLVKIFNLDLSKTERSHLVKQVMEYVQGPAFRNNMENIIQDTTELYESLQKEVHEHNKLWRFRVERYNSMRIKSAGIYERIASLTGEKRKSHEMHALSVAKPILISYEKS